MSRTFAVLEVSPSTYEEVAAKLKAAGYDHAFVDGDVDMHGIALRPDAPGDVRQATFEDHLQRIGELLGAAMLHLSALARIDSSGACAQLHELGRLLAEVAVEVRRLPDRTLGAPSNTVVVDDVAWTDRRRRR